MNVRIQDGKVVNPEGLEINATLNCNMRCRSCSHLAPLFRREVTDPGALRRTLTVLGRYYHASFAKILGGEPLLHPDLIGILDAVRSSQVADAILVCTNGTLLSRAPDEFWAAADAVEISVYPSRPPGPADLRRFQAAAREHGVDLTINYYGHFRVAYSETGAGTSGLVPEIFRTCKLAHVWLAHTVHDGWMFRCPQSVFLPHQVRTAPWDARLDGLEIEDSPQFTERLARFLTRASPLHACQHCLGSVGQLHRHEEVPRARWREEEPTERLVDWDYLADVKRDITLDDGCVDPVCPVPPPGVPG